MFKRKREELPQECYEKALEKLADKGDPCAIVVFMYAHRQDAEVQAHACRALWLVAIHGSAVAEGGITAIVAALKQHPTNAEVQQYGCKALSRVLNAENKVTMVKAGVKQLVEKAMTAGNASAQTQEFGQKLLDQLPLTVSPGADQLPLTVSPGLTLRAKRWGDGLDSPAAGSRHFYPQGFEVTLDVAEAISSFGHSAQHVARIMDAGLMKASTASTPLHGKHGAALYAYTEETPLYSTLNYAMRTPHTRGTPTDTELKRYADYVVHTQSALGCLQTHIGTVYRGIKVLLAPGIYSVGKRITWQAFSSSTKKQMATLEFVNVFPGRKLHGSIFVIESMTAKDIRHFSAIPSEEEVLFPPNSQFKVDKVLSNEQDKKRLLVQLSAYDMADLDVYQMQQIA